MTTETNWASIAALGDASRRALFDYVRHAGRPVSREEAAEAVEMSRNLAAFHLDKLVDAGLLKARYEAPPDVPRGRGRAPKVYEPVGDGLSVSIPPRQYELIAEILADGVVDATEGQRSGATADSAQRAAYRRGVVVGTEMRGAGLIGALDSLGFEPDDRSATVVLHNCPFHALAVRHTDLICGLNHAFMSGLVDGLAAHANPRLAPHAGGCCVVLDRPNVVGPAQRVG